MNIASISALWHGRKTPGGFPGYDVAKAGTIRMTTRLACKIVFGINTIAGVAALGPQQPQSVIVAQRFGSHPGWFTIASYSCFGSSRMCVNITELAWCVSRLGARAGSLRALLLTRIAQIFALSFGSRARGAPNGSSRLNRCGSL